MEGVTDQLHELSTFATNNAVDVWSFAGDFLIVLVLLATFFLFAWYVGYGPFIGLMISLYVGYALYAVFPYASYLPQTPAMPALAASIAVFIGLSFIAYLVLRRTVASDFVSIGFFGLIVLAFLGAGFLLALAYHVFPVRDVYTFTPTIDALFASKQFFFAWIVAPLVGLFFFVR